MRSLLAGCGNVNEVIAEFARIQSVLNQWLKAIEENDQFYPKTWALEKLWMDLEILKAAVYVQLQPAKVKQGFDGR